MKPLERLEALLKTERTARDLARLMGCSVPTAYRRLEALKRAGMQIVEATTFSKKTGPAPRKFRLVEA